MKEPVCPSWTYDSAARAYRYWLGERSITCSEYDRLDAKYRAWKESNPATGKTVYIKPSPDTGWEFENGGRGREISQFCGNKFKPGDPRNKRYFRSQNQLIETCKRENYTYERLR